MTFATDLVGTTAASQIADDGVEEMLLQFDLNKQYLDETVLLLRGKDGVLYAAAADLKRWRLRSPDVAPLVHKNEPFYPLKAISGLSYQIDETHLTVTVTAPAQAFMPNAIDEANKPAPLAAKPGLGGFFNYDLFAERASGMTRKSGLFEAGLFNGFGVGVGSFVVNDDDISRRITRLETTWTKDFPDRLTSLRLGDSISQPGMWGRSVRFGGIQYGTNFAVQPGFVALPLQSIGGQAALPSTVELYVNNVLSGTKEVSPGPFSIPNVPVVTGQGNVRLVVRDVLGREQVITQPFYASASLLAKGLHDYSYELGAVRENFGIDSNDYGRPFIAATHGLGLTEQFTGEVHGEAQTDRQTLGFGAVLLAPLLGTFSAAVAASHSKQGKGGLLSVGFDRQASPVSLGVHSQITSPRFTQLGLDAGTPAARLMANVNIGVVTRNNGSLGLAYVYLDNRDGHATQLASAGYSTEMGRWGFISLSVSKALHQSGSLALGAYWTMPMGSRTTSSVNVTRQENRTEVLTQLQRSLPSDDGIGYSIQLGERRAWDVELDAQNKIGTYSIEGASNQGQTGMRLDVSGGVALLDGVHLTRRITDSFAVVKVPDFPNVRIYADNQPIGRTDANGSALVPRLRAYEENAISLEQMDLPLDARIGTLQMDAMPRFRSGMILEFPVSHARDAVMTLMLDDGGHLPPGATVKIEGQREEFPVGHDGVVYLTGLSAQNQLHASWRGHQCEVAVPFPPEAEPLPDLGTFVCKEYEDDMRSKSRALVARFCPRTANRIGDDGSGCVEPSSACSRLQCFGKSAQLR
jgi:outer membrane usher protein